jgi:ABC-type microcin C transport system permease subunit YejE
VSISLGIALVAGKNRVPNPATGITAFLIAFILPSLCDYISDVMAKKFKYIKRYKRYMH